MNDELTHFRTKGSKNGERRYQYEDGSLTPLGREHYGVGPPRVKKSANSGHASSKHTKPVGARRKKEDVTKLSDEELRSRIARLRLENDYLSALDARNKHNARAINVGRRYVNSVENASIQAISKATVEVGSTAVKKLVRKAARKAVLKV